MKFIASILPLFVIAAATIAGAAPPQKLLESYPTREIVWLGSFAGSVTVNPLNELLATRAGEIEWKVASGAQVIKGASLANCGAAQIAQSERQLALNEATLPVKLREAQRSHDEKTSAKERQLEEFQNQLQRLELSKNESAVLGPELTKRVAQEKKKIAAKIEKLKEDLDPDFAAAELHIAKEQLRLDVERTRLEHLENIRSYEIVAPHDGILSIRRSDYIRGNEVVGTIENRGIASVTLQIADPEILNEKPEQLQISVEDPRGKTHFGNFSHIEKGSSIRMGFVIYHFNLVPQPESPLPDDLTGERLITVSRKLGRKAYIVPKTDFLFHNTEEVQRLGWSAFIQQRWPGAKIFLVGPRSLAIIREE